jgi:type IX secretion system PorP/SprF family membrane protein
MIKKTIFFSIILLGLVHVLPAQQEAMFTQHMFNTLAINPGYAGSRDALTLALLNRTQWVNFDGAPRTQTFTMHSPLFIPNTGAGLSVLNDRIGPTNNTSIFIDYSYKIQLSKLSHLVLGLKAGASYRENGLNNLDIHDQNDPKFANNVQSDFLPNFGFGVYYFTDRIYLGASIPRILENNYETNTSEGVSSLVRGERQNYYFIAGYVFSFNESLKFKPATLVRITGGAPVTADFSGKVFYRDRVWGGLMFRPGDAMGAIVGAYITQNLAFGYSYDWSYTNRTFRYNGGTHEIVLIYDFVFTQGQKIRSPRYF